MDTERGAVVAEPGWVPPALLLGFPLAGGAVAWVIQTAAAWLTTLPWVPRRGLHRSGRARNGGVPR